MILVKSILGYRKQIGVSLNFSVGRCNDGSTVPQNMTEEEMALLYGERSRTELKSFLIWQQHYHTIPAASLPLIIFLILEVIFILFYLL